MQFKATSTMRGFDGPCEIAQPLVINSPIIVMMSSGGSLLFGVLDIHVAAPWGECLCNEVYECGCASGVECPPIFPHICTQHFYLASDPPVTEPLTLLVGT